MSKPAPFSGGRYFKIYSFQPIKKIYTSQLSEHFEIAHIFPENYINAKICSICHKFVNFYDRGMKLSQYVYLGALQLSTKLCDSRGPHREVIAKILRLIMLYVINDSLHYVPFRNSTMDTK